jgi:hypothetical protein
MKPKTIRLGYFVSQDDAIRARHEAELHFFGKFRASARRIPPSVSRALEGRELGQC